MRIGAQLFQFEQRIDLGIEHKKNASKNRTIPKIDGTRKKFDLILSHVRPIIDPSEGRPAVPRERSGRGPRGKVGIDMALTLHVNDTSLIILELVAMLSSAFALSRVTKRLRSPMSPPTYWPAYSLGPCG